MARFRSDIELGLFFFCCLSVRSAAAALGLSLISAKQVENGGMSNSQ